MATLKRGKHHKMAHNSIKMVWQINAIRVLTNDRKVVKISIDAIVVFTAGGISWKKAIQGMRY